jgi:hypothetical protein
MEQGLDFPSCLFALGYVAARHAGCMFLAPQSNGNLSVRWALLLRSASKLLRDILDIISKDSVTP